MCLHLQLHKAQNLGQFHDLTAIEAEVGPTTRQCWAHPQRLQTMPFDWVLKVVTVQTKTTHLGSFIGVNLVHAPTLCGSTISSSGGDMPWDHDWRLLSRAHWTTQTEDHKCNQFNYSCVYYTIVYILLYQCVCILYQCVCIYTHNIEWFAQVWHLEVLNRALFCIALLHTKFFATCCSTRWLYIHCFDTRFNNRIPQSCGSGKVLRTNFITLKLWGTQLVSWYYLRSKIMHLSLKEPWIARVKSAAAHTDKSLRVHFRSIYCRQPSPSGNVHRQTSQPIF